MIVLSRRDLLFTAFLSRAWVGTVVCLSDRAIVTRDSLW